MPEPEGARSGSAAPRRMRASKVGVVVSDKMHKTVVVAVERMVKHPAYKRIVRRTSKFFAHDEKNDAHVGDQVEIVETRPMSKNKRWRVARIVARAPEKAREAAALPDLPPELGGPGVAP
jgi:small subunit ribosomal protein S17